MFDRFGEFESTEELNRAADGLLEEGDIKSLKVLAKENGLTEDDVSDYIEGYAEYLATRITAADGRLNVEEEAAKTKKNEEMIARTLFGQARSMLSKDGFAELVMQKGKRLMKVYEIMRVEASKHKSGGVAVSCGTDRELQKIILAYYEQGEDGAKKEIEKLYG